MVHFNSQLPVVLSVDASDFGLGAVISHIMPNKSEKPIAFASRTLNVAEKNYSQIEKEAASIIFALTKFHQFLYGTKFFLKTDCKPLVAIFNPKKGIPQYSANRLKRWAVILSNYQYEIHYVKSKDNIADFLSRHPVNGSTVNVADYDYINFFNNSEIPIDYHTIANEINKNNLFTKLKKYIQYGFPKKIRDLELKKFVNVKNDLTLQQNCIWWNNRVIIPPSLRKEILQICHQTHLGSFKIKNLAKSYFWWPGLNQDIENFTSNCSVCCHLRDNPPRAQVKLWDWPNKPWSRIHVDFFVLKNKYFFVILDSHSKWLEVFPMNSLTSQATISCLRNTFARYGLPDLIVSDNGRQLVSEETERFLQANGVKHLTIAPYHPMSNGAAENSVRVVKNALKKVLYSDPTADMYQALSTFLFSYRTTPHVTTGVTPSYLMFGREITNCFNLLKLEPKSNLEVVNKAVKNHVEKKQRQQVNAYKGNRNIEFLQDEMVLVKDCREGANKFIKGLIVSKIGNCMYNVQVPELNDIIWKRHVNQIHKLSNNESSRVEGKNVSETVNFRPKRNCRQPDRLGY